MTTSSVPCAWNRRGVVRGSSIAQRVCAIHNLGTLLSLNTHTHCIYGYIYKKSPRPLIYTPRLSVSLSLHMVYMSIRAPCLRLRGLCGLRLCSCTLLVYTVTGRRDRGSCRAPSASCAAKGLRRAVAVSTPMRPTWYRQQAWRHARPCHHAVRPEWPGRRQVPFLCGGRSTAW